MKKEHMPSNVSKFIGTFLQLGTFEIEILHLPIYVFSVAWQQGPLIQRGLKREIRPNKIVGLGAKIQKPLLFLNL